MEWPAVDHKNVFSVARTGPQIYFQWTAKAFSVARSGLPKKIQSPAVDRKTFFSGLQWPANFFQWPTVDRKILFSGLQWTANFFLVARSGPRTTLNESLIVSTIHKLGHNTPIRISPQEGDDYRRGLRVGP